MKCPKCKSEIEDDSLFCDQCGTELMICPQCGTLGKGKRCTQCGTELIKKSSASQQSHTTLLTAQTVPASAQPAPASAQTVPASAQPTPASAQTVPEKTIRPGQNLLPGHLVCPEHHIRLGLADGVIIGRRGHYSAVFAQYGDVSGTHAKLTISPAGCSVEDIESTNGTWLNGQQLKPHLSYPIHCGDILKFSSLTFNVEP